MRTRMDGCISNYVRTKISITDKLSIVESIICKFSCKTLRIIFFFHFFSSKMRSLKDVMIENKKGTNFFFDDKFYPRD